MLVKIGAADPAPLKPADLPLGGPQILAWPMRPGDQTVRDGSRLNKVLLLRLDPAGFDADDRSGAADGVVAYSAICPHTGCDVTKWLAETQRLECPCHFSQYDPKAEAVVVSGPSPRPLPALPLKSCRRAACRRQAVHRARRVSSRPDIDNASDQRTEGENAMSNRYRLVLSLAAGALALLLSRAAVAQKPLPPLPQPETPAPVPPILQNYKPVTAQRLTQPADGDWLMYRRTYDGWGYSPLAQITPANVGG